MTLKKFLDTDGIDIELKKHVILSGYFKDLSVDNLTWASFNGQLEVVKYTLKDKNIDLNHNEHEALSWAAGEGHLEICKLFLADKRLKITNGGCSVINRIIGRAWHLKDKDKANVMFDYFIADGRFTAKEKELQYAIRSDLGYIVKRILEINQNLDFSFDNHSFIRIAAQRGTLEIFQTLYEKGLDICDSYFLAAKEGKVEIIKFLLEQKEEMKPKQFFKFQSGKDIYNLIEKMYD